MRGVEICTLAPDELGQHVAQLIADGGRMQMAYAFYPQPGQLEVRYLASRAAQQDFLVWRCARRGQMPSIASISPLIGWYEREMTDLFGLEFAHHPEPLPLVLHQGARPVLPPLDPSYPKDTAMPFSPTSEGGPEIKNQDVQRLPFGPIRADVVESVELIFYYAGEHILHVHPQLFFKHRGMEKHFEGRAPASGVVLAERVSGVGSFAHALAFCQALEDAAGTIVPKRAAQLRVVFAELERIYNHLHYLGHLADTTTLKVGQAQGKLLEEHAKQINGRLTGSRFLRGLLAPGGLRRDVPLPPWFAEAVKALHAQAVDYATMLESTNSYLDRLLTTGVLSRQVAFDQGATGPIERASGLDRDLRRDHPYADYADLSLDVPVHSGGDAHARAQIRIAEIEASFALIERMPDLLVDGPVSAPCAPLPKSEGLGWAESPRGSLFYAVHLDADGDLGRVKIKSPSFSNWRVFPFTVHASNMMDYAINEASFGLTVAGCDR